MGYNSEWWQTRDQDSIWVSGSLGKNIEIELENSSSLKDLILISRRSIKNNALSFGFEQTLLNILFGGPLTIRYLYPKKSVEEKLNLELDKFKQSIDVNNEVAFDSWLAMAVAMAFEDGSTLINPVYDQEKFESTGSGIVLELIDIGRVSTPMEYQTNPMIRNGIHYEANGKIKGFYVKKGFNLKDSYDLDSVNNYVYLPAWKGNLRTSRLFHTIANRRYDQNRMPPYLTPILGYIRFVSQVLEATLVNLRVTTCLTGVMQTEDPVGTIENLQNSVQASTDSFVFADLKPGSIMISKMKKGQIDFTSPNRPGDNFDALIKRCQMIMGSVVGIPYVILAKDLENANYSNYRGAVVEASRTIFRWERELKPIINWILTERLKEITLFSDFYFDPKKVKIDIMFPKYQSLDPEKTERADRIAKDNGITTLHNLCDERQIDYEELERRKTEEALDETRRQALVLLEQRKLEEQYGIVFTDNEQESTSSGDSEVDNTSTEEEKERRKLDGNW